MTNTALCSGGGGGPQANGICYAHTSQGIGKNNGKAIYFSMTGDKAFFFMIALELCILS
jgi:hypothetical protein